MPFGLGGSKDKERDHSTKNTPDPLPDQTLANNVDPAQNKVNPQRLSRDAFERNSLSYGMRVPTGQTSTWDRRLTSETEAFHRALAKHHAELSSQKATEKGTPAAPQYWRPGNTSVNNYLLGEFAGTGEGMKQYRLGRQRGSNVEEPAHHFDFHKPTAHDRVHGAANIVAGKLRMDQDISTRAKAEFHGQTMDGH